PLQLTDLLLERLDPLRLRRRRPRLHAVIDISLAHPATHRLGAVAELLGHPLDAPVLDTTLGSHLTDQANRLGFLIRGVTPRRGATRCPFRRHDSILVSTVWSLQPSQGDSDHPGDPRWSVSHESIYQAIYVQAKGELR